MKALVFLLVVLFIVAVVGAGIARRQDTSRERRLTRKKRVAALENALSNIETSARHQLTVAPYDTYASQVVAEVNKLRQRELL